jgi:hypothetical protein
VNKEFDSDWCSDWFTGWKTWNRGLISAEERNSIFFPKFQDRIWGPVTLLFMKYVGNYFSGGNAAGA